MKGGSTPGGRGRHGKGSRPSPVSSGHSVEAIRKLVADSAERHKVCDLNFNEVDNDKNGTLDLGEIVTLVEKICKDMQIKTPPRAKVEELVKKTDKDGSGSLSLGEFRTLFLVVLKSCLKEAETVKIDPSPALEFASQTQRQRFYTAQSESGRAEAEAAEAEEFREELEKKVEVLELKIKGLESSRSASDAQQAKFKVLEENLSSLEIKVAQLGGGVKGAAQESVAQAKQLKALEERLSEERQVEDAKLRDRLDELELQLEQISPSSGSVVSQKEQARLDAFIADRLEKASSEQAKTQDSEAELLLLDVTDRLSKLERRCSQEQGEAAPSNPQVADSNLLHSLQEDLQPKLSNALQKLERLQQEAFFVRSKIEEQAIHMLANQARLDVQEELQRLLGTWLTELNTGRSSGLADPKDLQIKLESLASQARPGQIAPSPRERDLEGIGKNLLDTAVPHFSLADSDEKDDSEANSFRGMLEGREGTDEAVLDTENAEAIDVSDASYKGFCQELPLRLPFPLPAKLQGGREPHMSGEREFHPVADEQYQAYVQDLRGN